MTEKISSPLASPPKIGPSQAVAGGAARRDNASPTDGGVTFRVVVLSLVLAVTFGFLMPIIDIKLNNTYLGSVHLPPGAIAVLLLLLLVVNPLLRLLSSRLAFSRNEVLTVYTSCLFSALVPGHGAENFFVSNLVGPFYYATRENKWLEFLQPYLKPWFSPALNADGGTYGPWGHQAVEGWYLGQSGGQIPWGAWLVPIFAWGLLIAVLYGMLGCLSVMLRAQWGEKEALAFPLLRLPLEMTEASDKGEIGDFFRNPAMWVGFGVAVCIGLLNGLSVYYPDVPHVPMGLSLGPFFSESPWNQMGPMGLQIMLLAVGISYLLTAEVSFSLWFFVWFMQLQLIAAYYLGFSPKTLPTAIGANSDGGAPTFALYQQVGVYFVYIASVLWTGREHFRHIVRRAFGRSLATPEEREEALSYPAAFWGFIGCFSGLVGWTMLAGVRLDIAIVIWGTYLVLAMALTRVVVEGGLFYAQQAFTPLGPLAQIFGSGPGTWLAPSSLVPASFIQGALMADMRAFIMPGFMHSLKLAHDRKISARPLLGLIAGVVFVSLAMGIWMRVRMGYEGSGLSLNAWFAIGGPQQPALNAARLISGTSDASWTNALWVGLGAVGTWAVMLMRSRFVWFPFHPIGMLMGLTTPVQRLWFSVFLGWFCKVLITRFGGNDTYRKLIPTFLGLALGDVTMMLFWLLIDASQGRIGHNLMPG